MASKRYNTTTNYNYGSTAPDIYRDVHVPKVPKVHETELSRKQRSKQKKLDFKKRLSVIFSIGIVFIGCAAFVWGCAMVSYKQYELKQAKNQIRELKSQVNETKAMVASSTNLDHIKSRASNELNMVEPLPHQIVYLDIVKTSYTIIE